MSKRRSWSELPRSQGRLLGVAFLFGASLLLATGLPRVLAGLRGLPAAASVTELQYLYAVEPEELKGARQTLVAALRIFRNAETLSSLASIEAELFALSQGNEADDLRERAVEHLKQSLALAPGDGHAWMQLFVLRLTQEAPLPELLGYLQVSLKVSPRESALALGRLQLALPMWEAIDPETQRLLVVEIREAWKYEPDALLEAAYAVDVLPLIRRTVATTSDSAADYERLYQRLVRRITDDALRQRQ